MDIFVFEIVLFIILIKDCKLEFVICYKVFGVEFWDNNSGDNYWVMCFLFLNCWKYNNKFDYYYV